MSDANDDVVSVIAPHGDKTLKVAVHFTTNGIAPDIDAILPKHSWDCGFVRVLPNKAHGIPSMPWIPFHSMAGLPLAIQEAQRAAGVKMVHGKSNYVYSRREPGVVWTTKRSRSA